MRKTIILFLVVSLFWAVTAPAVAFGQPSLNPKVKDKFQSIRNQYSRWAEASPSGQNLERVKERIIQGIDRAIAHLRRRHRHMEQMRIVNQGWRDEAIEEINRQIEWLEQKKAAIEAAESFDQLRQEAEQVRNFWRQQRLTVKKFVGKILASRVKFIISKAERTYQKLEAAVEQAEESGQDVTQARQILSDLSEKLELVKESVSQALDKFEAISDPESAQDLFRQGHDQLKQARRYLQEFKEEMGDLIKEIKT